MRCTLFTLVALAWFLTAARPGTAGDEIKAVNLGNLNTEADENDPYVSPSGLLLFYASNRAGTWDIYRSQRTSGATPFPPGKPYLAHAEYDERAPFLFQSRELHLYFAKNPVVDDKLKDLKNFDIFRKTGERQPQPILHVSEKQDELWPWLTAGGKEFYFSRKLSAGWTLFVTQGELPGPDQAKKVGFEPDYCHATIDPKGLTMYLQGPLDGRRTGIYRSRRAKIGAPWSMPEEVTALNHPEGKLGTMSPCLAGDRLYFASDRPGTKGGLDLWFVPLAQIK
ncbi:MAG: hypothetical protein NZO58_03075 [Gemmataceae bacterium]|nr:hypothetical protein [Gemmataceae bacterium]